MKNKQIYSLVLILLISASFGMVLVTLPLVNRSTETEGFNITLKEIDTYKTPQAGHPASQMKFDTAVNIFNASGGSANIIDIDFFSLTRTTDINLRQRSEDIFVSLSNGSIYIHRGVDQPFTVSKYNTEPLKTLISAQNNTGSDISVPMIGTDLMDIDLDTDRIDIFGLSTEGYQYYYRLLQDNNIDSLIFSAAKWECQIQGNDTGILKTLSSNVTAYDRGELGGYLKSGEFAVGTTNGEVVLVFTERIFQGIDRFGEIVLRGTIGTQVKDIKFSDINLDGLIDIVILENNNTIGAFLNRNNHNQYTAWQYTIIANNISPVTIDKLIIDDLDCDGDDDILGISSSGQIYTWRNTRSFPLDNTNRFTKNNLAQTVNKIEKFDLDRDSDNDIVIGLNNGTLVIIDNQAISLPNLTKTNSSLYRDHFANNEYFFDVYTPPAGGAIRSVSFRDLDRDGNVDIITGHDNRRVYAMRNTIARSFSPYSFNNPVVIYDNYPDSRVDGLVVTDLNYDGAKDIVASYNSESAVYKNITVLVNPGVPSMYNSKFTAKQLFYETVDINYFTMADLDGNNKLDFLYHCNSPTPQIKAVKNIINGSNFGSVNHNSFIPLNRYTLFQYNSTDIGMNLYTNDISSKTFVYPFVQNGKMQMIAGTIDGLIKWVSSPDANGFNTWPTAVEDRVIGNTFGNEATRQSVNALSVGGHIKYSKGTGTGYTYFSRDAAFVDDKRVYYMIGDQSIPKNYTIFTNNSVIFTGVDFIQDQFLNVSVIVVSGFDITNNATGFIGTLIRTDLTEPTPVFSYVHRTSFEKNIIKIKAADLNNNGSTDVVALDGNGQLWVVKGRQQYSTTTFPLEKIPLAKFNASLIKDFVIEDLDSDGDRDIIVLTKDPDNKIYFIKNMLYEVVNPDFFNVAISSAVTATTITINATTINQRIFSIVPKVRITHLDTQTTSEFSMTLHNQTYASYVYTVGPNGTYRADVIANDEWFNYGLKSVVFFSDQIVSPISIVHRPYVSKYIDVFLYNTTEPIGNNEIKMNITDSLGFDLRFFNTNHSYVDNTTILLNNTLYYLKNGTWWIRITGLNYLQTYTIGINATDSFMINYYYGTSTFEHDSDLPSLTRRYHPTEVVALSVEQPFVKIEVEFNKPIWYLTYEVLNALNQPVLYGTPKVIENDLAELYRSSFITNETGQLKLRFYIEDKYGNSKIEDLDFFLQPFRIENALFTLRSSKSNVFTDEPTVYAHWRANFVFQFRIKYEQKVTNGEMAWTEWIDHDPRVSSMYYGTYFNDGFKLEFVDHDYGMKEVTLELKNPFETKALIATIEYRNPEKGFPIDIMYFVYGAAGLIGLFIIVKIVKASGNRDSWKKFVDEKD